jgi:hypothetical protein
MASTACPRDAREIPEIRHKRDVSRDRPDHGDQHPNEHGVTDYYVAVAAIYAMVTYLTDSILPAIVLHTGGNVFSNTDLWLYGQAEWQASGRAVLIWGARPDASFWLTTMAFVIMGAATVGAYVRLARMAGARKLA